jgi:hypothetical protein
MNSDILTVALTEPQCALLAYLLKLDLPGEIHSIVTAHLEPVRKTELLIKVAKDHNILLDVVKWQPTQGDHIRAFRRASTEIIIKLREALLSGTEMALSVAGHKAFQTQGKSTLDALDRALSINSDAAPPIRAPVAFLSSKIPVAKA